MQRTYGDKQTHEEQLDQDTSEGRGRMRRGEGERGWEGREGGRGGMGRGGERRREGGREGGREGTGVIRYHIGISIS